MSKDLIISSSDKSARGAAQDKLWELHKVLAEYLLAIMQDPDHTKRASTLGVVRSFLTDNGVALQRRPGRQGTGAEPADGKSPFDKLAEQMKQMGEVQDDDQDQDQSDVLDDDAGEAGSLLNKPFGPRKLN